MESPEAWRSLLARDLEQQAELLGRGLTMPATRLLNCELVLTLLADHLPNEAPELAWAVLNGYPFPALEWLHPDGHRAVTLARRRLPEPLGRAAWEQMLAQYRALPPLYRIYSLDESPLVARPTSVLPERLERMRAALQSPPPRKLRPARYVEQAGRYRFYLDRDVHEVEIPERAIRAAPSLTAGQALTTSATRAPIHITLADLSAEAVWMDQHAPAGTPAAQQWERRIRDLNLCGVSASGLHPATGLTLDGLLHLAGMVGSGKSTLFTVLAVYLARRGYRVVIVQGDVASLLREQAVFEALRPADTQLIAVPLVGRSTRLTHLRRLHALEGKELGPSLRGEHPAYSMLSTVCPLDGLRRDVQPVTPGAEPCTRLYPREVSDLEREAPSHARDCPLMPVCSVHLATRLLAAARIWLATPASLLASGPQTPLIPEELRNVELVMRHADVVLVDEADAVQVQFDDRFAPSQVLVGQNDAWLDRLAIQVARQVYRPARPRVGRNAAFDHWLTAHSNTQRAVDRLYRWLRESTETQIWLGRSYFSGERLLQQLEAKITARNAPTEAFTAAREALARSAPGGGRGQEKLPAAWITAVRLELLGHDEAAALDELEQWLRATIPGPAGEDSRWLEMLAHRLLIALIVSVLDHALQEVIVGWNDAEREIDLDRGSGGLFYRPSDSLVRLVPEAPTGAILGFQYYDPERRGDGSLRFFHIRGVGRALLYHLHDAYRLSDGIAGPHVLLTSGTSWAPNSWRYHLHIPPSAVLMPNREDGTGKVECFFEPLPDPENPSERLTVSGRPITADRIRSLRAMVRELARPRGFSSTARSKLDAELAELRESRQRILLVVGSYQEAEAVGEELTQTLGAAPGEKVLTLIPDSEGEMMPDSPPGTLLRSMLPRFAEQDVPFLVAPLQAIERGHNILAGYQAAIGSVYFLVRPLPRPGDLHAMLQRLNAWAMQFVPTLDEATVGVAGKLLREEARRRWDQLLKEQETYRGATDRTPLLWTQLVLVWQCIGRLLRGGADARVHFVDGKWAEVSAGLIPGEVDTEETSMLLGFERILREALSDSDPARRSVAETLYGPFARGLAGLHGVRRA